MAPCSSANCRVVPSWGVRSPSAGKFPLYTRWDANKDSVRFGSPFLCREDMSPVPLPQCRPYIHVQGPWNSCRFFHRVSVCTGGCLFPRNSSCSFSAAEWLRLPHSTKGIEVLRIQEIATLI